MKQILCDKCGKILVKSCMYKLKRKPSYANVPDKTYHLCDDCHNKFVDFIMNTGDYRNET